MPPHTRASMISLSATEKRSKLRDGHGAGEHLLLIAVKEILWVPKKAWSACTVAELAGIASGDFTAHVDVTNRDELGTLAANVNQMNDKLRRLYGGLETTSRHKSEFLAKHVARAPHPAQCNPRVHARCCAPRCSGR